MNFKFEIVSSITTMYSLRLINLEQLQCYPYDDGVQCDPPVILMLMVYNVILLQLSLC